MHYSHCEETRKSLKIVCLQRCIQRTHYSFITVCVPSLRVMNDMCKGKRLLTVLVVNSTSLASVSVFSVASTRPMYKLFITHHYDYHK